MKRLTLDETWVLCLKMWKWIIKRKKEGTRKDIEKLKDEWLETHGYKLKEIHASCFFCKYIEDRSAVNKCNKYGNCKLCPAVKIDPKFNCMAKDYHYENEPCAFYAKLVSLNKIRLKKKKRK